MAPFMTVSRHAIVDLAAPWDPQAMMREYYADPEGQRELAIPAEVVHRLVKEGGVFRLDAKYRSMGSLHASARVALLSRSQVDLELDGALAPSWWLLPAALPFRPRLRRFVETQIDKAIEELKNEASTLPSAKPEPSRPDQLPPRAPSPKGLRWTLEILSLDGQHLFRHSEGASGVESTPLSIGRRS